MSSGSVASDQWIEISVNVDHEAVEPMVELFSRYGYNNGVAIEEPFTQDPDGDNLTVDLQRPVSVRTFLPFDGFTSETKDRIERALWSLGQMRPVGPLMVSIHQEQDWENAWKQHFTPLRASKRIIIRPPWHDVDPEPDDLVVTLDPGMAFGTGTHPTTRLCLELMEDFLPARCDVLDAGTGTGVLALAARLLGARHVDAVDIDPIAVRQAAKNFEMNDQADGIRVWQDSMEQPPSREHYDFVIANIISRILIEVHPALVASMRPAGMVLLSGIIDTKEQLVVDCYQQTGLEMIERRQMGDWIAHIWANRAEGQGSG
ncbi:50S ribosomal protein L11 methyltransferase [soil metagenome]